MKVLRLALAVLGATIAAYGQGTILFNNLVPGVVDARFTLPDGSGFGAGWTAQLSAAAFSSNVSPGDLKALSPTTTFKTMSAADMGYVNPVLVSVLNHQVLF